MQDGNLIAEKIVQVRGRDRSESDFGNQQDRRAALGQHRLHRRQINRRLARAGDAVQQRHLELPRDRGFKNLFPGNTLFRIQLEVERRFGFESGYLKDHRLFADLDRTTPHQGLQGAA